MKFASKFSFPRNEYVDEYTNPQGEVRKILRTNFIYPIIYHQMLDNHRLIFINQYGNAYKKEKKIDTADFVTFDIKKSKNFNKFSPRLMFYNGFKTDQGFTFPQGSTISDNLELTFEDKENSIYDRFWKKYMDWYINHRKEIRCEILFDANDLANLDLSKKIRIRGVDYFIKTIKFGVTYRRITEAKLDLYSVIY